MFSHPQENDITWGCLMTMEKDDLQKVGEQVFRRRRS